MTFPHHDHFWQSAANFILKQCGENPQLLAPTEFHEIFPLTYPYDVSRHLDLNEMDALVIHKGALNEVGTDVCSLLVEKGIRLWGNEVFVVFALKGQQPMQVEGNEHFDDFYRKAEKAETFTIGPAQKHSEFTGPATVILMTTYNRPDRLGLSLESVSRLGAPILVVDDGSKPEYAVAYAAIYKKFGVRSLFMPGNRGLSHALNTGLGYWLTDPNVEWICYLQDDVEVRPDLLAAMARVQDAENYPLLTGRYNSLHKIYAEVDVNGQKVLLQRMAPGIHLHGHRRYWENLLPIPTVYFQAPKSWPGVPLRGADEDWWISQWSPHSVVKQGKYVAVLPDLVRTTTVLSAESTWGNPGLPDPPLPPPRYSAENFIPATPVSPSPPPEKEVVPETIDSFWKALASRFGQKNESAIHRHVPEEWADLYHAIDNGSTELEVLNFIHSVVCLFKPELALETGTFLGFGSCAIAAGLKNNGRGHLLTLEMNAERIPWSREHLHQFNPSLEKYVTFINQSSLDYIETYAGPPFNLVFFDTELSIRIQEFQKIRDRGLLASGAVCIIHDTSPHRLPGVEGGAEDFRDRDIFAALGDEFEVFQFPYSRGFHLLRYRGK